MLSDYLLKFKGEVNSEDEDKGENEKDIESDSESEDDQQQQQETLNNNEKSQQQQIIINEKKVMVPIYIQKKIYKYLIVSELDKSEHESYELNSKVIMKFSLLSWEWFNFISSKIYHTLILKDYNGTILTSKDNNNKYLLRKPDSIKYLKLQNLSRLNVDFVNQIIKSLPNLKWITAEHNNTQKFAQINFKNFRINSFLLYRYDEFSAISDKLIKSSDNGELNNDNNGVDQIEQKENQKITKTTKSKKTSTENNDVLSHIKRIDYIYIQSDLQTEKVALFFERCKVYGFTSYLKQSWSQYSIIKFPFKKLYYNQEVKDEFGNIELKKVNRLQWVRVMNFSVLPIRMFYKFLKSSPKLKDLTFCICFHNLIYQLHKKYGGGKYYENENDVLQPCECLKHYESYSVQPNGNEDDDEEESFKNKYGSSHDSLFSFYWDEISKLITNHKHLTNLTIVNKCYKTQKFDDSADNQNGYLHQPLAESDVSKKITIEQSQHFIQSFGNIIGANKSIKSLSIDVVNFNQLGLIESILDGNDNKTISSYYFHYKFTDINGQKDDKKYIKRINGQYLSGNTFKNNNINNFVVRKDGVAVLNFEKKLK